MSFFKKIEHAPDDPILSLGVAFAKDERELKANLGIGAYQTAEGAPHVLTCVRKAEARILEKHLDKSYLQINGHREYCREYHLLESGYSSTSIQKMILPAVRSRRATSPRYIKNCRASM